MSRSDGVAARSALGAPVTLLHEGFRSLASPSVGYQLRQLNGPDSGPDKDLLRGPLTHGYPF